MRLHTLRLANYRRFREVALEFPDGVLAVVGPNGVGKSTLVEAIGWALYGNDAARTGKDMIKRRGAAPGEDVEAFLRFEHAGHTYEVARTLAGARGVHTASLTIDGVAVVQPGAHSQREVAAYVARALHMDHPTFFASLVARQRDLAGLGAMLPADRKAAVLRMLRVDVVDEAVRLARQAKRDALREAELLAAGREPKELEVAEAAARETATRARAALALAEREAERLAAVAAAARVRLDELGALSDRHRALAERLAGLAAAAEGARREVDARAREAEHARVSAATLAALPLPDLVALRTEVATLESVRARAEARARAVREVAEAETRVRRLEEELPRLDEAAARVRPLQEEQQALREDVGTLRAELTSLETASGERVAEARRARSDLEAAVARLGELSRLGPDAPCPTCERPLEDCHDGLVRRLGAEAAALEARARELDAARAEDRRRALGLQESLAAKEERALRLEDALRTAVQAEARRAELLQRVAGERERLAEARTRATEHGEAAWSEAAERDARARLAAAEATHARAAALRVEAERLPAAEARLREAEAARAATAAARAEAEAALRALAFDPRALPLAQRAVEAALQGEAAERLRAERARGEAAQADAEAARAATEREAAEARLARRQTLLHEAGVLERLAGERDTGLLCDFKLHLAGRIRPALAMEASALYREMTDGRYPELELDEDYELLVHDDGEAFPLARMSGGEGDLANLCLRLAVGRVLAERAGGGDLGFLVLDEVFGSQDETRKSAILRALGSLANRFRQILLITHIEQVKEAVDAVLRVAEAPDGTSTVRLARP